MESRLGGGRKALKKERKAAAAALALAEKELKQQQKVGLDTSSETAPAQEPLQVRLDTPAQLVVDCGQFEVALGLLGGDVEIFIHFGNAPLKQAFMQCIRGEAPASAKRRRKYEE